MNKNSNETQFTDSTDKEISDYLKSLMVLPIEREIKNSSEQREKEFSEIRDIVSNFPTTGKIAGAVEAPLKRLLEKQLEEFKEEVKISENFVNLSENQEEIINLLCQLNEELKEELKINENFNKLSENQEEIRDSLKEFIPSLENFKTSIDTDIKEMKEKIFELENEIAKSKRKFSLYKFISLIAIFSVFGICLFFLILHFFK